MDKFKQLCAPAQLYFVLVIISIIVGLFSGFQVMAILLKLVFAFVWTFVLNWLCKKGWKVISWILVLLPFFFIIVVYLGMVRMSKQPIQMMNASQITPQTNSKASY